jgi:hypothetical protein
MEAPIIIDLLNIYSPKLVRKGGTRADFSLAALCEACFINKVNCAIWAENLFSERDSTVTSDAWLLPSTPVAFLQNNFLHSVLSSSLYVFARLDLRSFARQGLLARRKS